MTRASRSARAAAGTCRGGADVQILASDAVFLDELRATEYARLDHRGEVYLDYCGGSLYATSQVEEHQRLLRETVFGNPHSANPTSSAATALVERARRGAALLPRVGARVRVHLHRQRDRRAAARPRGLSVRAGRPVPGDLRQPQ